MSIPKFIERVCVQTAVYWAPLAPDSYGAMTYDDPVDIACRWEDRQQLIRDAQGKEWISRAQILVTQDVLLQGCLYLGSLDDFESGDDVSDPKVINGAYEILSIDKTPLFRSTSKFVRTVYL